MLSKMSNIHNLNFPHDISCKLDSEIPAIDTLN